MASQLIDPTMANLSMADPAYQGDLGNGLVRRWSTAADTEKIAHLMGNVFLDGSSPPPNLAAADEARMVMSGFFPFMGPGDYAIVEDTRHRDRPVVSAAAYWHHLWSYEGITFGVGRPENIGTDPAYRNKGLVRALVEMIHARSAAAGNLVDAITGIRHFYRQFGYEYVFDLGGWQSLQVAALPQPKEPQESQPKEEAAPYSLRVATLDDLPALMTLYDLRRSENLVWHHASEAYWRYQIAKWDEAVLAGHEALVKFFSRTYLVLEELNPEETNTGGVQRVCGYVTLNARRWGQAMRIHALELDEQVNWPGALRCLLQSVRTMGEQLEDLRPEPKPFTEIAFHLGRTHPAYTLFDPAWAARVEPPYAWYVRVADLPAFLQRIAPVLEKRLAQSVLHGYSGELRINLYRSELQIKFEGGKLQQVVMAPANSDSDAKVECPPLLFLQLLFGYRSREELVATFPDVAVEGDSQLLVDTLFPKQHSLVKPLL